MSGVHIIAHYRQSDRRSLLGRTPAAFNLDIQTSIETKAPACRVVSLRPLAISCAK